MNDNQPLYPIGVASDLLDVHPRTLRIYEQEKLVTPARRGKDRFFSNNDIKWIKCLRSMIHDQGISIPGIKKLMQLLPCWEIKNCSKKEHKDCTAFKLNTKSCSDHLKKLCHKAYEDICTKCETKDAKEILYSIEAEKTEKPNKIEQKIKVSDEDLQQVIKNSKLKKQPEESLEPTNQLSLI